jgi:hypothetical protein
MAMLLDQGPGQAFAGEAAAEILMHAVAYQHGEWWVGTCLERCIASQARTKEALLADLERMIQSYLRWAKEEGAEPFVSLPKTPKRAWDMYRNGSGERLEVVIRPTAPALNATAVELRAA